MTLKPGDKNVIKARMDELTEKRESNSLQNFTSAGSTFKRPPGYFPKEPWLNKQALRAYP